MKIKISEEKRQIKRKKAETSSRLLDNYYNPKIHKKNWNPGGTIKYKNEIIEPSTNLYSKSDNNNMKSKGQIHFLEFDFLENNDIIIIIEHCANCDKHLDRTNHSNDIFKKFSKYLQLSITMRFPFIKVYLKPIDTSDNKMNRIGALEIQLGMKIYNQVILNPIFSKLTTGQWPNIHSVLNKISSYMPIFNLKLQIYDKEEGEYTESTIIDSSMNESKNIAIKTKDEIFKKPSKYENIKINLYSYNSEQIEYFCKEASNSLDMIYNAKKKIEMYHENMTKSSISHNNNNNNLNATTYSVKSNLSVNNNTFNFSKKGEIIDDISVLDKMKGKLLCMGYADKLGFLIFENVPYDSYIVEIENGKKFLGCGMLLQFTKIFTSSDMNQNYVINKIFGLKRQIDAFLEVLVFKNIKDNEKIDIDFMSGLKVIFKKIGEQNNEEYQIELNENIKGKYEIVTEPCFGEISVIQNGKEIAKKSVSLNTGLNKINFELE